MSMKKVKVVLNADSTINATSSTVEDAGAGTVLKQAIPFLRDEDVAIVNGGTVENVVQTALLVGAAIAGDHFELKSKLGMGR